MGKARYQKNAAAKSNIGASAAPPVQISATAPSKNWWADYKSHPLFVITATALATAVACQQLMVPLYTAKLNNQVADLTAQLDRQKSKLSALSDSFAQSEKVVGLGRKDVERVQKERDAALDHVRALQLEHVFSSDDVFPISWREIRIGDSQESLLRSYPNVEKNNRLYWSVDDKKNPVFESTTYYFDQLDKTPSQQISHVLFHLKYDEDGSSAHFSHQLVQQQLSERFGEPKQLVDEDSGKQMLRWFALTYKLTLDDTTLHVETTCATAKVLRSRGRPFRFNPCN